MNFLNTFGDVVKDEYRRVIFLVLATVSFVTYTSVLYTIKCIGIRASPDGKPCQLRCALDSARLLCTAGCWDVVIVVLTSHCVEAIVFDGHVEMRAETR